MTHTPDFRQLWGNKKSPENHAFMRFLRLLSSAPGENRTPGLPLRVQRALTQNYTHKQYNKTTRGYITPLNYSIFNAFKPFLSSKNNFEKLSKTQWLNQWLNYPLTFCDVKSIFNHAAVRLYSTSYSPFAQDVK